MVAVALLEDERDARVISRQPGGACGLGGPRRLRTPVVDGARRIDGEIAGAPDGGLTTGPTPSRQLKCGITTAPANA